MTLEMHTENVAMWCLQYHCHPCRQVMHTLQASKNLIGDICALYGDLARMEQELLSKIPTTTVVDELCELA